MIFAATERTAVGRTAIAVIVVILLVVAAAAGVYYYSSRTSTTSSISSSSSTSSSSSAGGAVNTLSIDSWSWPFPGDLSVLNTPVSPWPEWQYMTVYQTLVTVNDTKLWDTGTVQFEPGLANYTSSDNNQTWTFNLRQNVKFSNGDPLNAYQVWLEFYGVYYLNGNSSTWLNNYNVFNYTGVNFGPSTLALFNQSGVINPSAQALTVMENDSWPIYVTGPYQLVMHLTGPFDWLPGTLLTYGGLIYDTQYVLDHGGFGTPASPSTYFNLNPIPGTGPYVVSQFSVNAYVNFTQSPTYWGDNLTANQVKAQPLFDPGHVKNVVVYANSDDLSRYINLEHGTAQIADIESSDWSLVTSNPSQFGYVQLPPWAGLVSVLGLNTQEYPTNITLVRQAIVHAINYTDLYDAAYLGHASPFMGPEYPAWSQFYDLGSFQPYQYNLTLAKQDLAAANIKNMPPLTLRIETGCEACTAGASVITADLAQIGITVNEQVLSGSAYLSVYGSYSYNVQNAQQIGQLSWVDGGEGWGAFALTPADYWVSFVSNESLWGNWAAYSNPTVQACVNAFTTTSNVTEIQQLCAAAQQQIYNDAPYAWIGTLGLWLPVGGSTVYDKNVISGFLLDPTWGGQSSLPIFNTVTFVNGQ